jgi:hypothetical protein
MKKGILLIGISYWALVSCGSSASLTENYYEDENFYNPALPFPEFALNPNVTNNPYKEDDYVTIWEKGESAPYYAPENATSNHWWNSSRGTWTTGFGSFQNPYYGANFGTPWYLYGMSNAYGISAPWNYNMYPGYGYSPYGYGYDPYGYGYNPYAFGYNPYSYGWGYGTNFGSNNGSTTQTPTKPGINYGGSKPSTYNRSKGNSATYGRTDSTPSRSSIVEEVIRDFVQPAQISTPSRSRAVDQNTSTTDRPARVPGSSHNIERNQPSNAALERSFSPSNSRPSAPASSGRSQGSSNYSSPVRR